VQEAAAKDANEWVVLVALSDQRAHTFFVVPRDVVVATVQAFQIAFDYPSRTSLGPQEYAAYKERWDLLERPSWAVPWMLPGWVLDYADQMEWPDGHPGPPPDAKPIDP
jgi:hypothetical protein